MVSFMVAFIASAHSTEGGMEWVRAFAVKKGDLAIISG
jgi:hypothetical protein